MKALSIWPEYATEIAQGWKTVEFRTWKTDYRGDLVICSSSRKQKGFVSAHALCLVELVDIVPFGYEHLEAAGMNWVEEGFAWILENPRMIKPVPVKGQLRLWEFNGPIEIIPEEEWRVKEGVSDEEANARWASFEKTYWEPLMTNSNKAPEPPLPEAKKKTEKENASMEKYKYEIIKEIGILSESTRGWRKEVNLISWNGGNPKYDIRDWGPDHAKMGKGITLNEEEAKKLKEILNSL